jgi:hypothetical protein
MPRPLPERSDDVTIHLVLNDYGKLGSAYVETDHRHVADSTLPGPTPVQTSPVDLMDRFKPDFEKRPAAPSVRREAIPAAGRKRS